MSWKNESDRHRLSRYGIKTTARGQSESEHILLKQLEEEGKTEASETGREKVASGPGLDLSNRYEKTQLLYTDVCDECGYQIAGKIGVNDKKEKVSLHTHCIVEEKR